MLPEQIARLLKEEDYRRLSTKLGLMIDSDYLYSKNRAEILQLITELAEIAYKNGRIDERYYGDGPQISLYGELE